MTKRYSGRPPTEKRILDAAVVERVKARFARAAARATELVPDGAIPELIAAVEALPDMTLLDRLAPEMREAIEEALGLPCQAWPR